MYEIELQCTLKNNEECKYAEFIERAGGGRNISPSQCERP
jgi:hypothetical protein